MWDWIVPELTSIHDLWGSRWLTWLYSQVQCIYLPNCVIFDWTRCQRDNGYDETYLESTQTLQHHTSTGAVYFKCIFEVKKA